MDSNNLNNTQQTNSYYNNGAPNNGAPNNGYPNNGAPNNGYPNNGYPNNGYPNNGYPNNGYPNNGNPYNYGNNQQPQEAPNIFQQFALSFVPPQYGRLTKVKTGVMIGFVMLLTLIATILSFMVSSFKLSALVNSEELENAIPDFEIKNGKLSLDKEFLFDEGNVLIYLTDEVDTFTYDDVKYFEDMGYTDILLMGKKNIALMQNLKYQEMRYSEFGTGFTLSKEWLMEELVPIIWVCIVVGYVFFYVGRTLWYFFCAAIYLLIALIMVSVMKKRVSAGALYRTAIYSKVFMFVIALLLSFIPNASMFLPGILRTIATIVFMGFAIAKLPDNC